ncbi:MAG: phosphopantetheine-binding protein [Myxococcota bacterium]
MTDRDLEERLRALSADDRARLATRLGLPVPLRLVGFVVLEGGTASEVQEGLRSHHPEHMVPTLVRAVETLPRLANGKLDVRALEAIADASAERSEEPTSPAPLSEVERRLIAIWKEVLGLDELTVNDDFYEVGGDSVSTIHILARARREGLDFDPAALVERPTVAALAQVTRHLEAPEPPDTAPSPPASGALDAGSVDEATLDELFGPEDGL